MKNDEPVRVFLGSHLTAQDAHAIAGHLQLCDIYVPELCGWNEATAAGYNAVADGRIHPEVLVSICGDEFNAFGATQLMMLGGSGKQVAFVDVPEGHGTAVELAQLGELLTLLPATPSPWDETVPALNMAFECFAEANRSREAHIVDRLCGLVASYPDLRILVRLGLAHTPVVRLLAARGIRAQAVYQEPPVQFGLDSQAYRYAQYGRPIPVIAIAHILFEALLKQFWFPPGAYLDSHELTRVIRRVVRKFTIEDIAQLWGMFYREELTREWMQDCMRANGFVLKVK